MHFIAILVVFSQRIEQIDRHIIFNIESHKNAVHIESIYDDGSQKQHLLGKNKIK